MERPTLLIELPAAGRAPADEITEVQDGWTFDGFRARDAGQCRDEARHAHPVRLVPAEDQVVEARGSPAAPFDHLEQRGRAQPIAVQPQQESVDELTESLCVRSPRSRRRSRRPHCAARRTTRHPRCRARRDTRR